MQRPLLDYFPTPDEVFQLYKIYLSKVDTCMGEPGFTRDLTSPRLAIQDAYTLLDSRSPLYGFFDTTAVSRTAYGFSTMNTSFEETNPIQGGLDRLASCQTDAKQLINVNVDALLAFNESSLPDGGPPTPTSDSRYLQAVQAWSECMTGAGFNYASPLDALGDPAWLDTPLPELQQFEVAAADIQCKLTTNLVGIAVAVQTAYDQQYINDHELQLTEFRTAVQEALRA